MNVLAKLFGSDDVVKKAADGLYNGIDKAILTKEELLDYNLKLLQAYEPFKVAQRLLALTFCIPYVSGWLLVFALSFFEVKTNTQMDLLQGTMGNIVLAITAFYFLGGVANGMAVLRKKD